MESRPDSNLFTGSWLHYTRSERETITSKMNSTKIAAVEVKPPPWIPLIVIPPLRQDGFPFLKRDSALYAAKEVYVWTSGRSDLQIGAFETLMTQSFGQVIFQLSAAGFAPAQRILVVAAGDGHEVPAA